jgi:thioesterase domain-containing protein/acyl carrier protein
MVATSEVEVALVSHADVADAAVIAVADTDAGARLVAYVVARDGAAVSAWKLRRDLAARLSSTSVPSAFVAVDTLPRTVRDKIDRAALPAPPPPVRPRPYREPAGNERDLAEIFADVLGVERVGLDDDFFEMGGDSLGVIELLAAVGERFSVDIPASTVLEAPTVAQLALRLSHRRSRNASPIVPLRADAPGGTFFCVTGGGAPAISLRALADAMDEQRVYAIQARGLEERAVPDHRIAAAARRDLLAMRAVQPRGPYLLGGYSYGGIVAFEMACRLRAAGEDVELLVVLDTLAPIKTSSVAHRVHARAAMVRADAPARRGRRAAVMAARAVTFGMRSAYAHAERRISLTSAGLLPRRGYHQYDLFLRLHARMAREYTPTHHFDGRVLVVRGDASDGRPPNAPIDAVGEIEDLDRRKLHDLGWSRIVTGPVTVVEVPADHLGLLHRPVVETVGEQITRAIAAR